MTKRPVAQSKIDLAKKVLADNPTITATQFGKDHNLSRETARAAINNARDQLRANDASIQKRAGELRNRQAEEALRVLDSQMSRLELLPEILVALRNDTFVIDQKTGTVKGIKEKIKAYNKMGDPVYLTPASIVNEYLEAERRIMDQERAVSGITAAEKAATASAGKPEVTLQLPFTPEDIAQIKPVD